MRAAGERPDTGGKDLIFLDQESQGLPMFLIVPGKEKRRHFNVLAINSYLNPLKLFEKSNEGERM